MKKPLTSIRGWLGVMFAISVALFFVRAILDGPLGIGRTINPRSTLAVEISNELGLLDTEQIENCTLFSYPRSERFFLAVSGIPENGISSENLLRFGISKELVDKFEKTLWNKDNSYVLASEYFGRHKILLHQFRNW